METFEELMEWMLAALPDAIVVEAGGEEIAILTGLALTKEDRLIPLAED